MKRKQITALILAGLMTAAYGCEQESESATESALVSYDQLQVGETMPTLKADLKILTNRTDLIDTDFADYIAQFQTMYPDITIQYEGITDYESDMTMRLSSGDWGDICCIPNTVKTSELSMYFAPIGDYATMDAMYQFAGEKMYEDTVYGVASMGNVNGVVYNRAVFQAAGVEEIPGTPADFLTALEQIAANTDAIPLYTNYAAGWTLTAWDGYITCGATGDPDFRENGLTRGSNPFAQREDQTGPYAVYQVLYEAVARGLTESDPTTTDWERSKSMLNSGEIGCMMLGSWAVSQIQGSGPSGDDVAYMPFPITVDGQQYAYAGPDYCYGINRNSSGEEKTAAMLYIKWLTESSGYAQTQGGIPTQKGAAYPDTLSDFEGVTILQDTPATSGQEDLFQNINRESELSLNADSTHVARLVEAAISGSESLDDIMSQWNQAWSDAQADNGVTPE